MAKFKAVARVKTGTVVTGYDIENEKGQRLRISRDYMCYLVGQGLVEGVTGAIYNDTVVLKGNLNQLPVLLRKEEPENQNTVKALVKDGRTIVGAHYEGKDQLIPRDVLEQDALSGKLTNLDAQRYKGKVLFKGVKNIPIIKLETDDEVNKIDESNGNEDSQLKSDNLIEKQKAEVAGNYKFSNESSLEEIGKQLIELYSDKLPNFTVEHKHIESQYVYQYRDCYKGDPIFESLTSDYGGDGKKYTMDKIELRWALPSLYKAKQIGIKTGNRLDITKTNVKVQIYGCKVNDSGVDKYVDTFYTEREFWDPDISGSVVSLHDCGGLDGSSNLLGKITEEISYTSKKCDEACKNLCMKHAEEYIKEKVGRVAAYLTAESRNSGLWLEFKAIEIGQIVSVDSIGALERHFDNNTDHIIDAAMYKGLDGKYFDGNSSLEEKKRDFCEIMDSKMLFGSLVHIHAKSNVHLYGIFLWSKFGYTFNIPFDMDAKGIGKFKYKCQYHIWRDDVTVSGFDNLLKDLKLNLESSSANNSFTESAKERMNKFYKDISYNAIDDVLSYLKNRDNENIIAEAGIQDVTVFNIDEQEKLSLNSIREYTDQATLMGMTIICAHVQACIIIGVKGEIQVDHKFYYIKGEDQCSQSSVAFKSKYGNFNDGCLEISKRKYYREALDKIISQYKDELRKEKESEPIIDMLSSITGFDVEVINNHKDLDEAFANTVAKRLKYVHKACQKYFEGFGESVFIFTVKPLDSSFEHVANYISDYGNKVDHKKAANIELVGTFTRNDGFKHTLRLDVIMSKNGQTRIVCLDNALNSEIHGFINRTVFNKSDIDNSIAEYSKYVAMLN